MDVILEMFLIGPWAIDLIDYPNANPVGVACICTLRILPLLFAATICGAAITLKRFINGE